MDDEMLMTEITEEERVAGAAELAAMGYGPTQLDRIEAKLDIIIGWGVELQGLRAELEPMLEKLSQGGLFGMLSMFGK